MPKTDASSDQKHPVYVVVEGPLKVGSVTYHNDDPVELETEAEAAVLIALGVVRVLE